MIKELATQPQRSYLHHHANLAFDRIFHILTKEQARRLIADLEEAKKIPTVEGEPSAKTQVIKRYELELMGDYCKTCHGYTAVKAAGMELCHCD